MTCRQYLFCVQNAADYTDRDAYVSDIALSVIWGDGEVPADRITALREIYTAYHRTVREISTVAGLSHRKLAERFGIPYRTMENWCNDVSTCPPYTCLMMQECLCLYHPVITP